MPKKGKDAASSAVNAGTDPFCAIPPPTPYSLRIRACKGCLHHQQAPQGMNIAHKPTQHCCL
jgi:hypothetical protein